MKLRVMSLVVTAFMAVFPAETTQEFRLPNGLRVFLVENHERPLVRLVLKTAWDPAEEPLGKEGLGGFLADMLRTGGGGALQHEAFQRFLEDRALRFSFSMQPQAFTWSVLSDSQGQDSAFESLTKAATRRDFDGIAMEAQRQNYLQAFKERPPRIRAERQFGRRIGDPSGSLAPEEASLGRIELQDLLLLARRIQRPEKSVLVIQGDMNLPQARQLAMLHLGAWGPSLQEPLAPVLPDPSEPTRTWMILEADRTIQVKLGASLGAPMPASTVAICKWLVNRELASGLPAPLVKVAFQTFPYGAWKLEVVSSPGKPVPEVMEAVQKLLLRLRGKVPTSPELAAARMAWNTERKCRSLHPQQEAESLAERALGSDELDESVDTLKGDAVQLALQRWFAPEACSYFVIGALPQDAVWLVQAGLGPVETIN